MADAQLLVSISADISDLVSQLSEASAALGDFGSTGDEASAGLESVSEALTNTGDAAQSAGEQLSNAGEQAQGAGEGAGEAGDKAEGAGGGFESLGGAIESVTSGFEAFNSQGGTAGDLISTLGSAVGDLLGPMGEIAAGAAGATAAILELASGAAETSERLTNLHLQTGLTTDDLQVFQAAAITTGTSTDAIGGAVGRLQMKLEQLASSNKVPTQLAAAMQGLGLTMTDLQNPEEALTTVGLRLNDALQGQGNYTQVLGEAQQIFGRNVRELVPALIELATNQEELTQETQRYGLTANEVAEGDITAEHVNELKLAWSELKDKLGAELMPILDTLATSLTSLIHNTEDEVVAISDFIAGIGRLVTSIETYVASIDGWISKAVQWVGSIGIVKTAVSALTEQIQLMAGDIGAAQSKLGDLFGGGTPGEDVTPGGGAGGWGDAQTAAITKTETANTAAVKKAAEDRLKIRQQEATDQQKVEDAQLAASTKHYEDEYNQGNITLEQEYAGLIDNENKKYAAQMAAYDQDIAALKASGLNKTAEIEKVQTEEITLTDKHNSTLEDMRTKLSQAQDQADQKDAQDTLSTQQQEATTEKTIQDSRIAVLQAWLNQRVALGQESGQQEVADQTTIDNLKYNEDRKALTDRLTALQQFYDDDSKEVIKANADIEALDNQHYAKQIADQTKAEQARLTLVKDSMAQISTAFGNAWDTLFNDAVAGSTKQQSVWSKMFSDILKLAEGWAQQMGKTLLEALLFGSSGGPGAQANNTSSALTSLLGLPGGGLLGSLFGNSSSGPGAGATSSAQTAAFQTAITSFQTASDNFNRILTGSTAAGASTTNSLANITNNLNTAATGVDSAGQDLTKASDNTQSAADAADTSAKDLDTAAGKTGDSASALDQTTNALGETVNSFDSSVGTFSDASGTLGNSASAMSEAATGLADATDGLVSVSDALGTAVTDLGNAAGGGGAGAPGGAGSSGVGSSISTAIANGFTNAQGVLNSIMTNAINQLLAPLTKVFTDVFNAITGPITSVFTTAINALLSPLTTVLSGAMSAITSTVSSVFSGAFDGSAASATSLFGAALGGNTSATTSLFETAFGDSGTTVGDIFNTGFSTVTKTASSVFSDAWGTLQKVVGDVFGGAWDSITKTVSSVLGDAFDAIKGTLSSLFSDIFGSIFSGLGSDISSILGSIGGIGSAGSTALGLPGLGLIGIALAAAGFGVSELVSLFGSGRPKEEATQDVAKYASSNTPVLAELGKGAQALVAAGIPLSSPEAGAIFGPYFDKARELEDVIRWGPSGLTDTQAQALDATTLKNALTEMGNPGKAGTSTLNGIIDAWNSYVALGGTIDAAMKLAGIPALQGGGLIGSTGIALLHAGEIVLPESVSTLLQGLAPTSAGPAGGSTVVFQISAIDSQDVEQFISDNRDLIADAVLSSSRGFRNLGRSF